MPAVTLPRREAVTGTEPSPRRNRARTARRTRVLVVEDEPVTAEVFARALQRDGHSVRVARDGNQAVHALRDHPPDLVVLDMNLPTLPGTEILLRLRGTRAGLTVPVVVVSGAERARTGIDEACLCPGRWLRKPVRPRDLVAAVRELFDALDVPQRAD
jgi:DNA-binding response OmpR family regulator